MKLHQAQMQIVAEMKEQRKLEKQLKNQRIKRKPKNSRIIIRGFDKANTLIQQSNNGLGRTELSSGQNGNIPEESKEDEVNME